jgi:tyrosyl-DNA phosphodiesterase-1
MSDEDFQPGLCRLWISPKYPRLPGGADAKLGDSPTNFKRDFLRYLRHYNKKELAPWIRTIEEHDLSSTKLV